MKKIFTLIATAICFMLHVDIHAQGIYQFWGTTSTGGKDDKGSFFSTKYDGTALKNRVYFTQVNSGRSAEGNQPVAYNGKLYSLLRYGGVNNDGIISEYDPATDTYTTRANIYDLHTGITGNSLVLVGNKMYGVSESSGSASPSRLFEFDPLSGSLTEKHLFTDATGKSVAQEPVVYNNKLYGMTREGGINTKGVIYEFDPATAIYTVKHHFEGNMNGSDWAGFTVYSGKLWSVDMNGRIFSFDPATSEVAQKKHLNEIGGTGMYGQLAVLNNRLYGVSPFGGPSNLGFIFEYNPASNALNVEFNFTVSTVNNRFSLVAYNGRLYGAAMFGGANDDGALISYDPVTNNYANLKTFNDGVGGKSEGRILVYNNKLYGWMLNGDYGSGVSSMFEYNVAGNQYALKVSLGGDELQRPQGQLMYYKNKLYGAATYGGTLKGGGIYSFDLQTQEFDVKVPMAETNGRFFDQGGFLLHNDKFYGVTSSGGANDKGTLFQYDPNSNAYTQLFNFGGADGDNPYGQLVLFNGKIYGTCRSGSTGDEGTIFEFDPITNVVTTKVAFDGTRGAGPSCGLTVYNGRLFGVTGHGGLTNHGVLFEYLPLPNALVKLADFNSNTTGSGPTSKLTAYNNKLWGVTESSSLGTYEGVIYEYDLATDVLSKKVQLTALTGQWALAGLTLLNNKLYGMTNIGGNGFLEGVLFEYDPATNNYTVKTDFEPINGKWPRRTELAKVPAPTAPGSGGSCINTQTININAANASTWIAFTDSEGRAVAEINANGNILGNTAVRVFVNDGNIRQHASGTFYLDRNITITAANTPVTPVSIRLYIRKTEFESLKATAGSGIVVPADLVIYKNNDFCSATMNATALPLATVKEDWGFDYVYSTTVTSFSSFYFAKLTSTLPVKIVSFNGTVESTGNKLEWKSVCTNDVDFIIERSTDGLHFDSIGIKKAVQLDCNAPFYFTDDMPPLLSYYRLKLVENNGTVTYSAIIVLQRKAGKSPEVVVAPNPVTGTQAHLQITSSQQQSLFLKITDVQGRVILKESVTVPAGKSNRQLVLPGMPAGIYYLQYGDGTTQRTLKFLRQ